MASLVGDFPIVWVKSAFVLVNATYFLWITSAFFCRSISQELTHSLFLNSSFEERSSTWARPLRRRSRLNLQSFFFQWNMGVSENSVPLNPMVLLIIIPMKNGYFIGNISPTFSDKPTWRASHWVTMGPTNLVIFWSKKNHPFWASNVVQLLTHPHVGMSTKEMMLEGEVT